MKLLRCIRFDPSDPHVFDHAAPEGDWAVSGAFAFADAPPERLTGKLRQAFANGFLGLPSLGRATFVTVTRARAVDRAQMIEQLADHFVRAWGAPSHAAARKVAGAEVEFADELCAGLDLGTVLSLSRSFDPKGRIREHFRRIKRPGNCGSLRVWDVIEEEQT